MQPTYTRINLSTPEGWAAFDADATAQWLNTCDEDERAEYLAEFGIQLGGN